ncbi:hypothetical protein Pint_30822 [Pistacia integerrima]|uniref:Uncharacterized protein n=1 Tax=Pistacia integerrima TaxID=434235 RepID=A0ACC0XLN0_9ROSI|nr:hypothetical protein Pint_30822 [Pistacia integerrima]
MLDNHCISFLIVENTQLQGSIPVELFSLPLLESVVLKNNQLDGTLDIGSSNESKLLHNNPICENLEEKSCSPPQVPSSLPSTPTNSCETCSSPPIIGTLYTQLMSVTFQAVSGSNYLEQQVVVFSSVNGRLNRTNFSLIISQLNNIKFCHSGTNFWTILLQLQH